MTVGERIRELRKDLNLTQTDFGSKIGLKQAVIGQYENNTRNVTDRAIKDICREFHISYAWLTNGDGDMLSNSDAALKGKVDQIMESENEFHKNLIESIIDLDDETLMILQTLINKLANKKAD